MEYKREKEECGTAAGGDEQLHNQIFGSPAFTIPKSNHQKDHTRRDFKEIRRILKPGGRFAVICDVGGPDSHWKDMIPGMKVYSPEQTDGF